MKKRRTRPPHLGAVAAVSLLVGGIGIMNIMLVSVVFGFFPARKAAGPDPIEALRHE